MARLLYFYVEVFGSNFDAEGFCREVGLQGAEVRRLKGNEPRHPIRAYARGNICSWQTPRHYYNPENNDDTVLFSFEFIYEQKAIVSFVNDLQYINDILPRYRTDTTESWLHLIYGATEEEGPSGVHFGTEFIEALYKLGASISTEVVFGSIEHY